MHKRKRKTPVVVSVYPCEREVKKVARFAFQNRQGSGADARGLTLADVEQEIHLKVCEVLYRHRGRPMLFVYSAMWNHAKNIKRAGRRAAQHSDISFGAEDTPETWCPPRARPFQDDLPRLEDRSCLHRLDARLSDVHKDTLLRSVSSTTGETIKELGLSYQGWRNRVFSARKAAAAELGMEGTQ